MFLSSCTGWASILVLRMWTQSAHEVIEFLKSQIPEDTCGSLYK